VTPTLARGNAVGMCAANAVSPADLAILNTRCSEFANGVNVCDGHLRHAVLLAELGRVDATPFSIHVAEIVGVGSGKKVAGIHAGAIVAAVADMMTIGYGAVMNLIRYAVGAQQWAAAASELAVSLLVNVALPLPALVNRAGCDVLPEHTFGCAGEPVAPTKTRVLSSDKLALAVSYVRDGRNLPATALAVTVRGITRGIMGLHKNLLSSCVVPPGDPTRRGGVFIGYATGVIIAQMGMKAKKHHG
jgi:hypothetical protein